jgi:hypothetical protein
MKSNTSYILLAKEITDLYGFAVTARCINIKTERDGYSITLTLIGK